MRKNIRALQFMKAINITCNEFKTNYVQDAYNKNCKTDKLRKRPEYGQTSYVDALEEIILKQPRCVLMY